MDTSNKRPVFQALILHLCIVAFMVFGGRVFQSNKSLLSQAPMTINLIDLNNNNHKKQQQIVETEISRLVNTPVADAKWGERTQIVDRETINKGQQKATQVAQREPLKKLAINYHEPGALYKAQELMKKNESEYGQRAKEYLKGVKEGDQTFLNTKEHVFFGYFQRIRDSLNRSWNSILKKKIDDVYRAGRQIASNTEHITQVYVVLNGTGDVINVLMLEESGTRQLDDAAVQAFKQAGPFPNPPKGLLDADGQVRVRWEFILRT